jgi:hypothetical protein
MLKNQEGIFNMQNPGVMPLISAYYTGFAVQEGVLAPQERELNTMYRQTNIGGTATPRPSVPIALFFRYAPCTCVYVQDHVTGPCGGVENRYRQLGNEWRC